MKEIFYYFLCIICLVLFMSGTSLWLFGIIELGPWVALSPFAYIFYVKMRDEMK